MVSNISADDEIATAFTALRMQRAHRFLIFKVSDDKSRVEIEHIGERESTFA